MCGPGQVSPSVVRALAPEQAKRSECAFVVENARTEGSEGSMFHSSACCNLAALLSPAAASPSTMRRHRAISGSC